MARSRTFKIRGRSYVAREVDKGEWEIHQRTSRGDELAGTADHMGDRRWEWVYVNEHGKKDGGKRPATSLKKAVDEIDWQRHERAPWARNPADVAHALPERTFQLGYALEVVITEGELIYHAEFDRQEKALLARADAFDRDPGYGRLYIIDAKPVGERAIRESEAADAYRDWHKGRDPDRVTELEGPEAFDQRIGRATRILYSSDKFHDRGDFVDYEHDFSEPGPLVYYADRPEGFALVGGSFTVDPRGIVD